MPHFTPFQLESYWGKWLGSAIIILSLLAAGLIYGMGSTFLDRLVAPNLQLVWLSWLFALGLFVFSFSKERIDDERVRHVRYLAFRAALMLGFLIPLVLFCPLNWDKIDSNVVLTVSEVPLAILFCVIVPLLTYQTVFNLALRFDPDWAREDSGFPKAKRVYWPLILLLMTLAFIILIRKCT